MLWSVTVQRARVGSEKRDREATLAVAANDLEETFAAVREFLAALGKEGWRVTGAAPCLGAVTVLSGQRDLDWKDDGAASQWARKQRFSSDLEDRLLHGGAAGDERA